MSLPLLVVILSFTFFTIMGVPLSFTMLLSSIIYFLVKGDPLYLVVHTFFTGLDAFTLLAIPFFILAGELMVYSGTVKKIADFSNIVVGKYRGGLAYVNVLASMLFGGVSGSAIADVGGIGRLIMDSMNEAGYDRSFSTALTVSSSIQGPLIPPSIMMVLLGAITGVSIGGLLLGGAIPGILVGVAQMMVIRLMAGKKKFPRQVIKMGTKEKLKTLIGAIPFLMMPFIILGGILSGIFTPTEASAIAVLYGLVLSLIVKKGRIGKDILHSFKNAMITSTAILMLTGTSSIFSRILAVEKVPDVLTNFLESTIGDNRFLFLLFVNVFLLLFGMVMDAMPALLVLAPTFLPVAVNHYGLNPVHFGVVMGFNLIIGLMTPPYGAALFTGAAVSGLPIGKIAKDMVPFIIASIIILFLVTYFPETVLFLPKLFGMAE
ncbi:MAG: TRAP transporter large permease [Thermotoga sp.]|nr:MAG: TRAP transporter large permease [Thermotoga sp.]